MVRARIRAALALLVLFTVIALQANAAGVNKRVRFPRGANATTIAGSVIRGDRDRYLIGARAGQKMTVKISAEEQNAVFQIYQPGNSKTLAGAGEGQDATDWSGSLPVTGDYTIVVGGTRGNATYKLNVKIE